MEQILQPIWPKILGLCFTTVGPGRGKVGVTLPPFNQFPPALLCAEERTLDRIRYGFILHD